MAKEGMKPFHFSFFAGKSGWKLIIVAAGLLLVAAVFVVPALSRARSYSGPGIHGNLVILEVAKARWVDAHKGGSEWPTMQELLPYLTNGAVSFGYVRHVHKEIYFINKVGAPVYAFDPVTEKVSSVSSNDWSRIEQMKE